MNFLYILILFTITRLPKFIEISCLISAIYILKSDGLTEMYIAQRVWGR